MSRYRPFLFAVLLAGFLWPVSAKAQNPVVTFDTSAGSIVVELLPARAPKTVANFVKYVKAGHYNGTIFHRVIRGFMIQGGGFDIGFKKKPAPRRVQNEADNGLKNATGTIAMARTSDPHSASAQFFINTVDNTSLNHTGKTARGWGYAVFGRVVAGMDAVRRIEDSHTTTIGPYRDAPEKPILIKSATLR